MNIEFLVSNHTLVYSHTAFRQSPSLCSKEPRLCIARNTAWLERASAWKGDTGSSASATLVGDNSNYQLSLFMRSVTSPNNILTYSESSWSWWCWLASLSHSNLRRFKLSCTWASWNSLLHPVAITCRAWRTFSLVSFSVVCRRPGTSRHQPFSTIFFKRGTLQVKGKRKVKREGTDIKHVECG